MKIRPLFRALVTGAYAVPFWFAVGRVLLQLALTLWGSYGIFRDELYYIACAEHPAAGYVDQPPLSILILAVSRLLTGDSLFALRFLPALAAGATVFVTGLIVAELGGGRRAQAYACIAWCASLINLGMFTIYSMNAFDHLLWALGIYQFTLLLKAPSPRRWLLFGVLLGLGLLNKISILWLGAGIGVAIAVSRERGVFRTVWPWAAAGVAMLLFTPFVVWNLTHDMAHLEFIRNATAGKYSGLTPWTFISGQLLIQNPVNLLFWFSGLLFLFFGRSLRQYLPLAIVFAVASVILLMNGHSKAEYLAPAYPPLFAAGGVLAERLFAGGWRTALGTAYLAGVVIAAIVFAPLATPVLPVETYIRYAETLGIAPSTPEHQRLDRLPQFYADMFGWEKKAADVAQVFNALPASDRKQCAIFGDNYGRCAAIDLFGLRYGLPKAIGSHNNYWLWGPRDSNYQVIIILGGALADKQRVFDSVAIAGVSSAPYCMPYENNLSIYVCRGLKVPLKELWPRVKHYE
jgi:4-amino-4-deoxy-L-arabinose transferase-like glycosyltransferase